MSLFKKFKKNIKPDQEEIESETEDEEIEEESNVDEEGEEGVEEDLGEEENEQDNETGEESPDEEEEEEEEKSKKKKKEKKEKNRKGNKDSEKDSWPASKGRLAADVYETETDFCLQIPIAGVSQEDIEIFVENNMLIIKGERNEADQSPDKRYFHQECYWGPFSRNTMLPNDVNTQKILASFKKGILTVKIPRKKEENKKSSIKMK